MPVIPKPINHQYVYPKREDIVRLFFDGQQSRDFYVRGSIVWPKKPPKKQQHALSLDTLPTVGQPFSAVRDGFALLAGKAMDTGQVWIFEEYEFLTVDNYPNPDTQALERAGLQQFLLKCFSQYGCFFFFYSEDFQLHKGYYLQCLNNAMIQPTPVFVKTPQVEDERVRDNIVEEYLALDKLKGDPNSKLYQHINTVSDDEPHGIHAIRCLLAGYEANPRRGG